MKKLIVIAAIALAVPLSVAGATTYTAAETANRDGLTACVLVDEAVTLGLDPLVVIPATDGACRSFRLRIR